MTGAATRILIVDDDDGGRYLKAHILRKNGYGAVGVGTGRAAIEHCEAVSPDLVLLDMRLPDIPWGRGVPADQGVVSRHCGAADLGRDHQPA